LLEHLEKPENQAKPYPHIALLGFEALNKKSEHTNNITKMVKLYDTDVAIKLSTPILSTPIKEFLAWVSTEKFKGKINELDDIAMKMEEDWVRTVE